MKKAILFSWLFLWAGFPAWAGINFPIAVNNGAYLSCGTATNIMVGTAAETIAFWWIPGQGSSNGGGSRLSERDTTGTSTVVATSVFAGSSTGTNTLLFSVTAATTSMVRTTSDNAFMIGTPQFVVMTTDGSQTAANTHIYVNNAEETYQTTTNGVGAITGTAGTTVYIGNRGGTGDRVLGGTLLELEDWNTQLSAAQRTAVYNGGKQGFNMRSVAPTNLQSWWRLNECPQGQACTTASMFKDQMGNNNCSPSNSPVGVAPVYSYQTDSVFKNSVIQ